MPPTIDCLIKDSPLYNKIERILYAISESKPIDYEFKLLTEAFKTSGNIKQNRYNIGIKQAECLARNIKAIKTLKESLGTTITSKDDLCFGDIVITGLGCCDIKVS